MVEPAWRASASLTRLQARARLYRRLRAFFLQRGVLEVETPILSRHATTDPALESLGCRYQGPGYPRGLDLYLHTSPEFAMKRLLASGSGPIFQIARVFRDGEAGRRHNPEFSLLEWYRPGFDHCHLMDEVADLIDAVRESPLPREWLSYRRLFEGRLGINPHRAAPAELKALAEAQGLAVGELQLSRDGWLDLLMSHCLEPSLGGGMLSFVVDYPASQAALARTRVEEGDAVAERFELYLEGLELANGFHELIDADEQRRRFAADNRQRRAAGQPERPEDEYLLAALAEGLPACSGVALGLDRLLMVLEGASRIDEVLAFPLDRA